MRDRTLRAAAAAFLTLVLAAVSAGARASEAPAGDLAEVHAARFAAMVEGDLETLGGLLADGLTYIHSDGRVESKEQLLASLAGGGFAYLAIESEGESAIRRYGGGEVGVITGAARFRVRSGEREVEVVLRYTSVYARADGRWRLAAWHSSAVRP